MTDISLCALEATGCVFRHAQVCVKTCLCTERGFLIALHSASLPPHSWSKDQRYYSAIKLLLAGVTHSGTCADEGANALKHHICTYTHIVCVYPYHASLLHRASQRARRGGSRRVKHRAYKGVTWHAAEGRSSLISFSHDKSE